jgi:hypothetical protein
MRLGTTTKHGLGLESATGNVMVAQPERQQRVEENERTRLISTSSATRSTRDWND